MWALPILRTVTYPPEGTVGVLAVDPIPVTVVPDWMAWTALFGTLLALGIAIRSYQVAKREATKSRTLIATERRTTFELEVLRDLLDTLDSVKDDPFRLKGHPIHSRLALFSDEAELRHWRVAAENPSDLIAWIQAAGVAVGVETLATTAEQREAVYKLAAAMKDDVLEAIDRRMKREHE